MVALRGAALWAGAVLLAGLAGGCERAPAPDYFARGEYLTLEGRFNEAVWHFKQHLLEHPHDAGAHFYLGRCYLNYQPNPWLALSQGELETALRLFEKEGKICPIKRFDSAEYFELICNVEMAKVFVKQFIFLIEHGANRAAIESRIELCAGALERARAIRPDSGDVIELESILNWMRETISAAPVTQSPPRSEPESRDTIT